MYGIFNSCKDQIELETKVVASFDQAKNNIETMRLKVEKALELTRLTLATYLCDTGYDRQFSKVFREGHTRPNDKINDSIRISISSSL